MESLNALMKIKFVSDGLTPGGETSGITGTATGDGMLFAAFAFVVVALVAAAGIYLYNKKFASPSAVSGTHANEASLTLGFTKVQVIGAIAAAAAIAVCVGLFAGSNLANAENSATTGQMTATELTGTVSSTDGSVEFSSATVTNGTTSKVDIVASAFVKLDGVEDDDCTWTLKSGDTVVYNGKATKDKESGKQKLATKISVEGNGGTIPITLSAEGLSADTAKALVDKDVAEVTFYGQSGSISGTYNATQTATEKSIRDLNTGAQIYYVDSATNATYTTTVNADGTYEFSGENCPAVGSNGVLKTSATGAIPSTGYTKEITVTGFTGDLPNQNFSFASGPALDNYTMPELKSAANYISTLDSTAQATDPVYKEFNYYVENDSIWYSNSCGKYNPSAPDATVLNQDYKCSFTSESTIADVDQFLFLRIIGLNHDDKADGTGKAGLTLQCVHALPVVTKYFEKGVTELTEQIDWWGNAECTLRNKLQSGGAIYEGFNSVFKDNIVKVNKYSQKTRGTTTDGVQAEKSVTKDDLFVLSYSEMATPDTEYKSNDGKIDYTECSYYCANGEGSQYQWYKTKSIVGNYFTDSSKNTSLTTQHYTNGGSEGDDYCFVENFSRSVSSFVFKGNMGYTGHLNPEYSMLVVSAHGGLYVPTYTTQSKHAVCPCFCF